jgi:hypothetical protein
LATPGRRSGEGLGDAEEEHVLRIVVGLILVGHALVHLFYLSPASPRTADGPEWPFVLSRSWLVTKLGLNPEIVRALGVALVMLTLVTLVLAGLASIGLVVPQAWWPQLAVSGAVASLAVLVLFFHPWLLLGVAIDLGLLYLVLVANWSPLEVGIP